MKCPSCEQTLSISSREGVEIDFCPQCRGVWLDRGELDKILDRAAASLAPTPAAPAPAPPPAPRSDDRPRYDDRSKYDDRYRNDDRRSEYPKKRKKKPGSFLEDIFDF